MPDASLNPYAPPVAAETLAPADPGRLWMVQGGHLLVRDGARLPPVSLFGGDGGELISSQQVFAAASGASVLATAVPLTVALLVMVFVGIQSDRIAWLEGAVVFFIMSRLLRSYTANSRAMANVQCHVSLAAVKASARRDRWRGRMMLGAMIAGGILLVTIGQIDRVFSLFGVDDDVHGEVMVLSFMTSVAVFAALCFFGSLIWSATERGLRCVRHTDGWFYLAGVPAASLMKLAAMTSTAPPMRMRKVYTLYQYRLPMGILLGPRLNPWLMLILAIMKATRSAALVRKQFHWTEARSGVAPGAELNERIAKLRGHEELASWQLHGCHRLDSPQGEMSLLTARLGSPDRRHFCNLTIARISKGRIFVEVCQADFRTWTADGRCLITSNLQRLPKAPAYLDFEGKRGDALRVWSRHRQRCERITPRAVETDEELSHLLEKETSDHTALLEAAGIQSPVEEVEMPGDWDELEKAAASDLSAAFASASRRQQPD
ncbi:hypothetical protein OKA05_10380 [Luteolibacter arcticus]|uniref:Uncharacterized protein n=1 Tax=Luteolibacter arcticus TaxID=1581411 RepID=A0ABT3GH68_9BACT|nr:hypothetical protein [Luteolibacter arcticus]MCW1922958.1 hypothetical protein [Luteolibacter arcticus]